MSVVISSLTPVITRRAAAAPAPGVPGTPESLSLEAGRVYEFRCSDDVVMTSSDEANDLSVRVYRDTPMRFRAADSDLRVQSLTTSSTLVWLFACEVV